jgi:hypothetical protein
MRPVVYLTIVPIPQILWSEMIGRLVDNVWKETKFKKLSRHLP